MTLRVISISQHSRKNHWCDNACQEYTSRLAGYDGAKFAIEELVLKPAPGPPRQTDEQQKQQEGKALLDSIHPSDKLIILDERGKSISTMKLAEEIQKLSDDGTRRVNFCIGGASGHSDEVRSRADYLIKVSDLVL
eukprot:CAMPEP_0167768604 /NCGR_PEP_ID=MMETSP0110_2-20121227/16769_1 /TAXON_ID=629695 /ORGANISM="Gymnochlora sp., Strain CCMP2014" /LENGTH=135 /DNA_ID=CAMNT_0007657315 /DNA_START=1 /DNA_END=408 /DNA_ORIENTATION=-